MNLLFAEEIKQTEKRKSLCFDHLSFCLDRTGIANPHNYFERKINRPLQDCWHSWSSHWIFKGFSLQLGIPQSLQCSASDWPERGAGKVSCTKWWGAPSLSQEQAANQFCGGSEVFLQEWCIWVRFNWKITNLNYS